MANHPTKKELIDYLKADMYIDDMIRVESHLEECPACRKRLASLKGTDAGVLPLDLLRKGVLFFVMPVLLIVGVIWVYKFYTRDDGVELDTQVQSLDTDLTTTPVDFETPVFDSSLVLLSVDTAQEQIDEVSINSFSNVDYYPAEEENEEIAEEQEVIVSQLEQRESITEEVVSIEEQSSSQQPEEEVPVKRSWSLNISSKDGQSAFPSKGFSSYSKEIERFLKPKLSSDQVSNSQTVELIFEVSGDTLSKFVVVNTSSNAYANEIINAIKKGSSWESYISPEYVSYNKATVLVKLTLK